MPEPGPPLVIVFVGQSRIVSDRVVTRSTP
jgi:hypothetical protein